MQTTLTYRGIIYAGSQPDTTQPSDCQHPGQYRGASTLIATPVSVTTATSDILTVSTPAARSVFWPAIALHSSHQLLRPAGHWSD